MSHKKHMLGDSWANMSFPGVFALHPQFMNTLESLIVKWVACIVMNFRPQPVRVWSLNQWRATYSVKQDYEMKPSWKHPSAHCCQLPQILLQWGGPPGATEPGPKLHQDRSIFIWDFTYLSIWPLSFTAPFIKQVNVNNLPTKQKGEFVGIYRL